jgi:hypothetical protein
MSNLLKDASILLTPTGYDNGSMNAIKPENGDGDMTFSRNSAATRVNAQGLVENVQILSSNLVSNGNFSQEGAQDVSNGSFSQEGSELVVNGDFATDSDWTKSTGITIGGSVCSFTSTPSIGSVRQSIPATTVGTIFKVKYEVLSLSEGAFNVTMNGRVNQGINATTVGIHIDYIVAPSLSSTTFGIHAVGTTTGSIDNVSVKEYITATNTPRLDYSTGSEAFLLEPQSTNLITQSELFSDSYWTKIGASVVGGFTSPSGGLNAFKLVEDTSTGEHRVKAIGVSIVADRYSFSVFVKPNGRNQIRISGANYFSGGTDAYFNLDTKVITYGTRAANGLIETFSNGWYRCSFSSTSGEVAGGNAFMYIDTALNGSASYTGDGTSGVYIYGAQLEQSSYATSPIPTSGATATRNQELCTNATPVINSEEGTLYAEISALANDGTYREISLNDGTTNNVVEIRYNNITNQLQFVVRNGGSVAVSSRITLTSALDFNKIAFSYKSNDYKMYVNGIEVGNATSGLMPSGLNALSFDWGGSNPFFGNTKGLKYYPKALADVQLEDLTTI